jgi:hypothetical protein
VTNQATTVNYMSVVQLSVVPSQLEREGLTVFAGTCGFSVLSNGETK